MKDYTKIVSVLIDHKIELEKELATVTEAIALFTKNTQPTATVIDIPTVKVLPKAEHKTYSQGLTRDVLLNLYTGKTTVEDLVKIFKLQHNIISGTLGYLIQKNLVREENNLYFLTAEGIGRAKWFQEHPQYKVYREKQA